tara:strand:- start:32784 stop:33818 length:1035 start_codon:yes stop_codon:yes gene_type:complete
MYITITAQKSGSNYSTSVADFVAYLEKENEGKIMEEQEHFFNHFGDKFSSHEVIQDIDTNTAKLKKTEPRFYTITVSPSKAELKQLQNNPEALKEYTKAIMEDYAKAFHREIEGKPITVTNIKYYAKVEHERSYKGTDRIIQENAPFRKEIVRLKNEIQEIKSGTREGSIQTRSQRINQLLKEAPHKRNGKLIVQGMAKEGAQSHIHIIVSRKDQSNRYSLSPGSKHKASETMLHGKLVKRGFHRDAFYENAEKKFDALFKYDRNYVEKYASRKMFIKDTKQYYTNIMGLPANEKAIAFQLLGKAGLHTSLMNIPTNRVQLVLKAVQYLKRGIGKAIESGSIGI